MFKMVWLYMISSGKGEGNRIVKELLSDLGLFAFFFLVTILTGDNGPFSFLSQLLFLIATIVLISAFFRTLNHIPLRVCKAMFICPAGQKEKLKFLKTLLFFKCAISFIGEILFGMYLGLGFFINMDPWVLSNIIMALFFFNYTMNLKLQVGVKGNRKRDDQGYAIYSPSETAVNTYWNSFLIIEITLALCLNFMEYLSQYLSITLLLVCTIINVSMMLRHTKPILLEALNYENMYHQEPIEVVQQYDIA